MNIRQFSLQVLFVGAVTAYSWLQCSGQASSHDFETGVGLYKNCTSLLGNERFGEALEVCQRLRSAYLGKPDEADALVFVAMAYEGLGNFRLAVDTCQKALSISEQTNDYRSQLFALTFLGNAYQSLGRLADANSILKRALILSQFPENRDQESETLSIMGQIQSSMGHYAEALATFRKAQKAADKDAFAANIATANMAAMYMNIGQSQKALPFAQEAYQQAKASELADVAIRASGNLAAVYGSLEQLNDSLDLYMEMRDLAHGAQNKLQEAFATMEIGKLYHSLWERDRQQDYRQKAEDFGKAAIQVARQAKDKYIEAGALDDLGDFYSRIGDRRTALMHYRHALQLFKSDTGDLDKQRLVIEHIGIVYRDQHLYTAALSSFNKALKIAIQTENYLGRRAALEDIGITYERMGQIHRAILSYEASIKATENVRTTAGIQELKAEVTEQSVYPYERAIFLKHRLGKDIEAFDLSEHARARGLLDQITALPRPQADNPNKNVMEKLLSVGREISALSLELIKEKSRPSDQLDWNNIRWLEKELADKKHEYSQALTDMELSDPSNTALAVPLQMSQVQQMLNREANLQDTTLLSFFVGEKSALAFVVSRKSFVVKQLAISREELSRLLAEFRGFGDIGSSAEILRKLHSVLIAPLEPNLTTHFLGIIPHGVLHYLPFAALGTGPNMLGQKYTLFTLPSASALRLLSKPQTVKSSAMLALAYGRAVGWPPLPYAESTATRVASNYGTKAFVGNDATRSVFLERAGHSSVVFLMAHAALDSDSPLFSHIVLAPGSNAGDDGLLEVREVYGLDLRIETKLVVLAGCQTGLGQLAGGDDVIGLNTAFISAGAPAVVASLWSVQGIPTSEMMISFFDHLKSGLGTAEALKAAQADVRSKYPEPYYWAGFVLTGDPR